MESYCDRNILESNPKSLSVKAYIHHVPKCMSCHKVIVVITGRTHCFHDCMFSYIYIYIYIYKSLYIISLSVKSFLKSCQEKSCSTSQRLGLHFKAGVVQFHQTTFSLCLIVVPSCSKNVIILVC